MSRGKLANRWDPDMALYRLEIAAFAYPVQKLKSLTVGKPQYGANERGIERTDPTVPRYVRITDIDEHGRLKGGLGVAAENVEDKYFLRSGDLLFARSGNTVGKAYLHHAIHGQNALFAGYMIRFRANVDKALPAYLFLCTQLEFYRHWVFATQRATGQPNINAEEYRSLELPTPNLGVQSKLVEDYKKAVLAFEAALREANNLLLGIDDYLLAELGIHLPPEPENTLANRIFTAQRREFSGFRFDARVHRANFDLVSTRFNSPPLKQIAEVNPRTIFKNIEDGTRLTFVPMEAITDEDGTIDAPQERSFAENVGYTSFQEGDLLWAKITPCMENGKSAVAEGLLNGYGFGSTEYHVFRPKSSALNVKFLHALLRMKVLRQAAKNYFGGSSGHQRVDEAFFTRLHIPLPDEHDQHRIVTEIESRRTEARRLRADAETELEAAKRRIEAMLLGGAA